MAAKIREEVVGGSSERENLYLWATLADLSPYCKYNYNAEQLKKIIMGKYPKLGYQLIQHFYDLCLLNPNTLQEKYKLIKHK
jgi:hypothetical protein